MSTTKLTPFQWDSICERIRSEMTWEQVEALTSAIRSFRGKLGGSLLAERERDSAWLATCLGVEVSETE